MKAAFLFRILFFWLFASLLACSGGKYASGIPRAMDGTWVPQRQEMGGKELPAAYFEKQRLAIADTSYTLTAESVDKGLLKVSGNRMDIYGKEGVNSGKHFTALWKLHHGELTICYNLKGDAYPDSLSTKGKPLYFLSVFRKQ